MIGTILQSPDTNHNYNNLLISIATAHISYIVVAGDKDGIIMQCVMSFCIALCSGCSALASFQMYANDVNLTTKEWDFYSSPFWLLLILKVDLE